MKRTEAFAIPYPESKQGRAAWNRQFGLNAYYSGKHWSVRKNDAVYWHNLTALAMEEANCRKVPFEAPAILTFWFCDRMDCSNHGAMVKMIEDAMKGRLLKDDSPRYVAGIEIYFHEENYIKVQIREAEK